MKIEYEQKGITTTRVLPSSASLPYRRNWTLETTLSIRRRPDISQHEVLGVTLDHNFHLVFSRVTGEGQPT